MEVKAYFDGIHRVIIDHLESAQSEIVAAVAWFTDREIFEALCKRARSRVKTSIALLGDDINQGAGSLNFARLTNLGGQVTFLPAGSRTDPIMHHKFCVIDCTTVITGSYNWSRKARSNAENITVATQASELAEQFLDQFAALLGRSAVGAPEMVDAEAARRRLEMIRNLILLSELEELPRQLQKLRPVAGPLKVEHIVAALEKGEFQAALEFIDAYLRRATALILADDVAIPGLRFQLQILELRLAALSDEKAELERRLIIFNRRHDDALGDLIRSVLEARAELKRLRAQRRAREAAAEPETDDEAVAAAEEAEAAERAYREYAEQHEELQSAEPLPRLDEAAERDLKNTYRKACMLCHPDKVSEDFKDAAHLAFLELQDAYKRNDVGAVKKIYEALQSGLVLRPRSTVLNAADSLRAAIAELEHTLAILTTELLALKNSDGVRLMDAAGTTESGWEAFFERQRRQLTQEMSALQNDLSAERQGAVHA